MKNALYLAAGLLLGTLGTLGAQVVGTEPVITGYTAVVEQPVTDTVRIGQTIAIVGQNFGVQPGAVQIGCIEVVPTAWSPTRITFVVPPMTPSPRMELLTVLTESPRSWYRTAAWRVTP